MSVPAEARPLNGYSFMTYKIFFFFFEDNLKLVAELQGRISGIVFRRLSSPNSASSISSGVYFCKLLFLTMLFNIYQFVSFVR